MQEHALEILRRLPLPAVRLEDKEAKWLCEQGLAFEEDAVLFPTPLGMVTKEALAA